MIAETPNWGNLLRRLWGDSNRHLHHVAVTLEGEALSVARYVGKKAKEVRAKLGEPDDLPSVDEARAKLARDMRLAFNRCARQAKEEQDAQLAALEAQRQALKTAHQEQRRKLREVQAARQVREAQERQKRFRTGLRGLWDRLSGQYARLMLRNREEAATAVLRDRQERDELVAFQLGRRQALQQRIRHAREEHAAVMDAWQAAVPAYGQLGQSEGTAAVMA